jgi:voltage-gated potassium channel
MSGQGGFGEGDMRNSLEHLFGRRVRPVRTTGRRRGLTWLQALLLVGTVSAAVVGAGGLLVRITDPERFPDLGTGLWWAVTTVTTVGYGDHVPQSGAGRLVGAVIMIVGIGCFAFLTAVAASAIVVHDVEEEDRLIEQAEDEILAELRGLGDRMDRLERLLARPPQRVDVIRGPVEDHQPEGEHCEVRQP